MAARMKMPFWGEGGTTSCTLVHSNLLSGGSVVSIFRDLSLIF